MRSPCVVWQQSGCRGMALHFLTAFKHAVNHATDAIIQKLQEKFLYLILYKINKNIHCLVLMVEIHINAFI